MLRSSRLIGYAAALALSVISTVSLATVVLDVPSLTGSVEAKNFADGTPNTFDVRFTNLNGTVTAVALPDEYYKVKGSGTAVFVNTPGGATTPISILSPWTIFAGALSSKGITAGTYSGTFVSGGHTPLSPFSFQVSYDGQTGPQFLALLGALAGVTYVDARASGTLDVTGTLYSDGADFSFTESNLKYWSGFGALLNSIDQAQGGANGIIDGTFALTNVVVTAVPEPAPLALIGLALAGLAWVRRGRRLRS